MRRSSVFEFISQQPVLTGSKVRLRPRRVEDAADSFRWRTDEELCQLDATVPMPYRYAEFFDRFLFELEYPGFTYSLSIDSLQGRHIGECSLFGLDVVNDRAEVGIMIGEKDCWGCGYGRDALETFLNCIFRVSDLKKLMLRTLDWNIRAQRCFERCGFQPSGLIMQGDYCFILMDLARERVVPAANKPL